jgi:hypothetical protein
VQDILSISDYLRTFSNEIGEQVVSRFPPLHRPGDPVSPYLERLKRQPFLGQELAIMGIVKAWEKQSSAMAIAECGTGKTLIALSSIYAHAEGRAFRAIAMVPPQLVLKWARECFLTIPGVRVFLVDGMRNGVGWNGHSGVNGVRFRNGQVRRSSSFRASVPNSAISGGTPIACRAPEHSADAWLTPIPENRSSPQTINCVLPTSTKRNMPK